jgi:hypothetical protein
MGESPLRRCGRCGVSKPLEEFSPRKKGGWQGYCRPCHKAYKHENYLRNRDRFIARALAHQQQLRATIRAAKNRPCADCGQEYPPYVMDFDHREGETKVCNVSALHAERRVSMKKLLAEIAKCDLVCANCHRERTHQRNKQKKAARVGVSE